MYEKIAKQLYSVFLSKGVKTPALLWRENTNSPERASILLLTQDRMGLHAFFYAMISRWLLPGVNLEIISCFSTRLMQDKGAVFIAEITLLFDVLEQKEKAAKNFSFLRREILVGVSSFYQGSKILEMKGMSLDDRTAFVQDKIGRMIRRFPKHFDYDLFSVMQRFFAAATEEFRLQRKPSEMARIIFRLYSFGKVLSSTPQGKRQVLIKYRKTLIETPLGIKEALALFIGVHFLKEHELFEERHLLCALSSICPNVRSIQGSYVSFESGERPFHTFYLEVEKEGVEFFRESDLREISSALPTEIATRVEQLVPPVFMPRNEEEVMRNILALSHQLNHAADIPQMVLSFDEQTDTELSFTVILVRLRSGNCRKIQDLFAELPDPFQCVFDRIKVVGYLGRSIPKEAAVLRIRMPSGPYFRDDYSVDLMRARCALGAQLENLLGKVRDYNGGMIAKQSENYALLQNELGSTGKKQALLLQNFFHSIAPAQLSSTVDPKLLKISFEMLLEGMGSRENTEMLVKRANDFLFVCIKLGDFSIKKSLMGSLESLQLPSNEFLHAQLQILDASYLSMIYLSASSEKQEKFLEAIPQAPLTFAENPPY